MKSINLITIQSKVVLEKLLNNKIYHASFSNVHSNDLRNAYEYMMKCYNYKYCPIFASVVGKKCEFYGAQETDVAIIELKVPISEIKLQEYYNWSDLICSFSDNASKEEINTITKAALFSKTQDIAQATLQYLDPKWLINYTFKLDDFMKAHYGSGGNNILKSLNNYIN